MQRLLVCATPVLVAALALGSSASGQGVRGFESKKTSWGELKLYARCPWARAPERRRAASVLCLVPRRPHLAVLAPVGLLSHRRHGRVPSRGPRRAAARRDGRGVCVGDARGAVAGRGWAGGHLVAVATTVSGFGRRAGSARHCRNPICWRCSTRCWRRCRAHRGELAKLRQEISPNCYHSRGVPPASMFLSTRGCLPNRARESMQKARKLWAKAWVSVSDGQCHRVFQGGFLACSHAVVGRSVIRCRRLFEPPTSLSSKRAGGARIRLADSTAEAESVSQRRAAPQTVI